MMELIATLEFMVGGYALGMFLAYVCDSFKNS